jgi:ATP/maltotriose-dependent transcriptional regulator MalT/DNA-binding SARP family transcriptional activator
MAKALTQLAKLSRPRLFEPLPRERLFARLDQLRQLSLVWVSGPPGSGKTSLVSSWLDTRKLPFAWYQVDLGDAEPATSFAFLVELARRGRPRAKPLPYLTPDQATDLRAFSRNFFRELFRRLAPGSVLVFDNCQEAPVATFHTLIEQAAGQLPQGMTLVAISRMQPPAELSRLLANRTLGVLGWDDMRLNRDEAEAIVKRTELPEAAAEDVLRQADGWAAGLVLLAANARRGGSTGRAPGLATREELFAYFAGEIFEGASAAHRDILICTALLPEVSPRSAIALSDDPSAADMLEQLYRRQYFTDRRTDPQLFYRYHDLFREFLVARGEQTYPRAQWETIVLKVANHLVESSDFESAIVLFGRIAAWDEVERVILLRAGELMRQGRWRTLMSWLKLLPHAHVEQQPRLLYWLGIAQQVEDVLGARAVFERAVRLFQTGDDRDGEALAISAVVDGYFQEWNTVVTLDPWLDELLRLLRESDAVLSSECLSRAQTSLLIGLLFRRPGDPALRACVEAITARIVEEGEPSERLRMMVYLVLYHDLMGNFAMVRDLIARIGAATTDPCIAPRLRVWAIFRFAHHYMNAGEDRRAREEIENALKVSRQEGVDTLSAFLLIGQAMILLNAGCPTAAQDVLQQAAPLLKASRPMELVFYKWVEFSIAVAQGDLAQANVLWDAFAKMPLIGVPHNFPYNHGTILLLVQRGVAAEALVRVAAWRDALAGMGSTCLDYNLDLMEAYIHLQRGDDEATVRVLRSAFSTAAARGFYGALCWLPELIRPLCAVALREGIEPAFVANLILRKRLRPPSGAIRWVWPVTVHTLGRFAVVRNGDPIRFARRPQHRPLELLQAIIAAAAGGASTGQLIALLWPDSEGDAAHNALNAALHRLRRLLGDERSVLVTGGRVALNPEICWVDALAFDHEGSKALSEQLPVPEREEILQLYRGHFLGEDVNSAWAIAYRDRLRAKFQRLVAGAGALLEQQREWRRAAMLYRRALEVDNLQEESYRRLMICLRELGETAEAKTVYRRCADLLSIVLGAGPSPETVFVFRSLRD